MYNVWLHIYSSKSIDQPGKVANPARGQLNRENIFSPVRVRGCSTALNVVWTSTTSIRKQDCCSHNIGNDTSSVVNPHHLSSNNRPINVIIAPHSRADDPKHTSSGIRVCTRNVRLHEDQ